MHNAKVLTDPPRTASSTPKLQNRFSPCFAHSSGSLALPTPRISSLRLKQSQVPDSWLFLSQRCRPKSARLPAVAIAATQRATGGVEPPSATASPLQSPISAGLANRVIFGILLGGAGALVILAGGWIFATVCCLAVYQASQEYYGFITSQGITKGMKPPPPVVSSVTSLLCIGITWWTFATNGTVTAALAVASFALMSLQLLAVERPRFSQLASSVFGLFYCGTPILEPLYCCMYTLCLFCSGVCRGRSGV